MLFLIYLFSFNKSGRKNKINFDRAKQKCNQFNLLAHPPSSHVSLTGHFNYKLINNIYKEREKKMSATRN